MLLAFNKYPNSLKIKNVRYISVDGADELFGGYKIYEDLDWKSSNLNLSPYSSINKKVLKKFKIKDKIQ